MAAEPAARTTGYRPRPYRRTPVPDARTLHVMNRFANGWSPGLAAQIRRSGGVDRWFAAQLDPSRLPDSVYSSTLGWWSSNTATAATLYARQQAGTESIWDANANYQRWSMVRRVFSERQVLETMAAFWEHHFHVPANGDAQGAFRAHYGRTIRGLALGRFDTLLNAVTTHPAMGTFLGNAQSTKAAPNENLGRELLELHTVGRAAGYTEDDVKSSARILTGWRVDLWKTWGYAYDPASHWTGPVQVLGFSHPNADPDGRAVTKAYLDYLAHHPSTARTIARKLAVHFVSDTPSTALVEYLARVYLANGTAITPVLRALVATAEFRTRAGWKARTPEEDLIATYRALGCQVSRPVNRLSAANAMLWQSANIGLSPFSWPRPDGRPSNADAWSSVSRMLGSFAVHYNMAGGWSPRAGVTFRTPAAWLPQKSIRFDQLVDHLARSIQGRRSTSQMLQACCQATGLRPATVITRKHALVKWGMPRLLTVFLDNPQHFTR
ncbi:DUF1800 domain-containing protein [Marmoricola sp. RAF53]|uniref:DUF1800 domain-containing protein n=1 Tax=Marmoricola sp. RAF53 TaxID=3233059 RepID=UPI003F9C1621